ncbi:MAG: hypothetical protein IJG33_16730 [Selenomonadaceae bacterium]|nr:hypothetical protein [Selenomonadaceae bacterium]
MADEKILKDKGLKDEKILKDELLSEEELDKVAGGKACKMFEQYQNPANDQNTPANQLGVKKAIKWD